MRAEEFTRTYRTSQKKRRPTSRIRRGAAALCVCRRHRGETVALQKAHRKLALRAECARRRRRQGVGVYRERRSGPRLVRVLAARPARFGVGHVPVQVHGAAPRHEALERRGRPAPGTQCTPVQRAAALERTGRDGVIVGPGIAVVIGIRSPRGRRRKPAFRVAHGACQRLACTRGMGGRLRCECVDGKRHTTLHRLPQFSHRCGAAHVERQL